MNYISNFKNTLTNLNFSTFVDVSIALSLIIITIIISPIFAYLFVKIFRIKGKNKKALKYVPFYKPIKLILIFVSIYAGLLIINLPSNYLEIAKKILKICTILLITKGFADLFNSSSDIYEKFIQKLDLNNNSLVINFTSKIIKILLYIVAGFMIITELGYDLGGLATGLGISSVVIALAAQDIAKNILAGMAIIIDKPFKIGDFITIGTHSGTVENITFRSTCIRNANDEIVIIPNSEISTTVLVNSTKREKRKYDLNLTLDLTTPIEKVHVLNDKIIELLNNHPNILKDSIKVFFNNVSYTGFEVSIALFTDLIDYMEFMKFKEEINYSIFQLIKQEHIELAFNSQDLYIKKS